MRSFLDSLNFPEIDQDVDLNSPLEEEIMLAMKCMQNNKALGPDGFLVIFFSFKLNWPHHCILYL